MFPQFKHEKWNIIKLFPEEHLIAHLLLTKLYPSSEEMIYSINMMSNRMKIHNKIYAKFKKEFSKIISTHNLGKLPWNKGKKGMPWSGKTRIFTDLHKQHIRETSLGKTHTDETKAKISYATKGENNPMYGRNHTESVKKKQSDLVIGKVPVIDEYGNKFLIEKTDIRWLEGSVISLTKGRKHNGDYNKQKEVYICPHCGKEGKGGLMFRWHFDNCKIKGNPL